MSRRLAALLLGLGASTAAATPSPSARPSPSAPSYADQVHPIDATHFRLDATLVPALLVEGASEAVLGGARAIPVVTDGDPRGYKLFAVRPRGLLAAVGLRTGDVVAQIDGNDITSPDEFLALTERLKLRDHFTLTVERSGATVQFEYLVARAAPSPHPSPPPRITAEQLAKAVHKIDATHYRLDGTVGRAAITDGTSLAMAARIIPAITDGQMRGFRLQAIRSGELLALCGLKNGDIVTHLNGQLVTGPSDLLAIYATLPTANQLTITVLRGTTTFTLDYVLQ